MSYARQMLDTFFFRGAGAMNPEELFARYRELQEYVGWADEDARRVAAAAPLLESCLAICRSCGDESERHAAMHAHCRICAQACRRCEQACRELLAALN